MKVDINAYLTKITRLENLVKSKESEIKRLNMVVRESYEGKTISKTKVRNSGDRHPKIKDGLGHKRGEKTNGKQVTKGWESPMFVKGTQLGDLMDVAHGTIKKDLNDNISKVNDKKSKGKKRIAHVPSPSYTNDYMVTLDSNGKFVVKYVGAYTKKSILRSVWVPRVFSTNHQGPKSFWVPKSRA